MTDSHEIIGGPERTEQEYLSKEQALTFVQDKANNWRFEDKTDKENIWFTYNTIRWIVESFGYRDMDWSPYKHTWDATVPGELLPEPLKPFVMTMVQDKIEYDNNSKINASAHTESFIATDGETDKDLISSLSLDEIIKKFSDGSEVVKPKWVVYDVVEIGVNLGEKSFEFKLTNRSINIDFSCSIGPNRDVLNFVIDNEKDVVSLCKYTLGLALLNAEYCQMYHAEEGKELSASSLDDYEAWMSGEKTPPKKLDGLLDKLGPEYKMLRFGPFRGDGVSIDSSDIIEI